MEFQEYINLHLLSYLFFVTIIPIFILFKTKLVNLNKKAFLKILQVLIALFAFYFIFIENNLKRNKNSNFDLYEPYQMLFYNTVPFNYIVSLGKVIQYKLEKYQIIPIDPLKIKITSGDTKNSNKLANKARIKKTLFVMIIGESARRDHLTINGYERNTTPQIIQTKEESKKNGDVFINFTNFNANIAQTVNAINCIFAPVSYKTCVESEKNKIKHEGLLKVLELSGFENIFIENSYGSYDIFINNKTKFIYKNSDKKLCNSMGCYDQILLNEMKEISLNTDQNYFIILHQIGSHGANYSQRYPNEFEIFKPTCRTSNILKCTKEELINTYDNSILYSDYINNEVINFLKNKAQDFNVGMVYFSDHGESLGEGGLFFHGHDTKKHKQEKEIPLYIWLYKNYNIDNTTLKQIQQIQNKELFHEDLFDITLKVLGLKYGR